MGTGAMTLTTEALGLSRVRGLRLAFQVPDLQLSNAGSLSLIKDLAQHITDNLLGIDWARARPWRWD